MPIFRQGRCHWRSSRLSRTHPRRTNSFFTGIADRGREVKAVVPLGNSAGQVASNVGQERQTAVINASLTTFGLCSFIGKSIPLRSRNLHAFNLLDSLQAITQAADYHRQCVSRTHAASSSFIPRIRRGRLHAVLSQRVAAVGPRGNPRL